ncbi:hypothetical protein [uncultured Muribaculum sp.]|uniref:hypothetical protein n=1 Tax=uncultured Muribaculum sp. TaxID=1918613 RepID=UPI00321FEE34
MQNEKSVKSYPPPEKFSYPHLIRVWAFVLLFVFVFVFTGCADSTEPPPSEPATYQKQYALYLPVERYENIDCEIDYYFTTPPSGNIHNLPHTSLYAWNLYHLEERDDGDFVVTYNRETEYPFTKTLKINYDGLDNEAFAYICGSQSDTNELYYSTYVVENFEVDHSAPYAPRRIWTIRAFVILIEENNRILMREFLLRAALECVHDENGNEVYEGAHLLDDNYYRRLLSQNYTPA